MGTFQANKVHVVGPEVQVSEVIEEIIEDGQESCFYLCNLSDIVRKHKNWKEAVPRVETFYAIKCNNNPTVLDTLSALGANFDCASKKEIGQILAMGVHPDRIIFANPIKKISHISYAAEVGVSHMTFDSEHELFKIKELYPRANLVLRIRFDDTSAKYKLGLKFGADPKTEALELLRLAKTLDLKVIGVSFHVGSLSRSVSIYERAIATSKTVFDLGIKLGFDMKLLDIGGGFPGHLMEFANQLAEVINPALDSHFPDRSVRVIAEPGRYYVDSAFTFVTNITCIKNGNGIRMYYVDSCVFNSLVPVIYGDPYTPKPLFKNFGAPKHRSIVWGATCDSTDKLCDEMELPEMKINDWIVFENAGAYTITLACEFNGFPLPDIFHMISLGDRQEIVDRNTDDYC